MRNVALAVAAFIASLALLAPAAQAKELQANVVSLQSQLTPGEPVPVVFELYFLDRSRKHHVGGAVEPAVVLVGEDDTRRFPAAELGGGRYSAEIVFPAGGDWKLRVAVGDLALVQLGKGAVRINDTPSTHGSRLLPELPLMLASAALIAFLHVRSGRT